MYTRGIHFRNLKNTVIGNNKQKTQVITLGVVPRLVSVIYMTITLAYSSRQVF